MQPLDESRVGRGTPRPINSETASCDAMHRDSELNAPRIRFTIGKPLAACRAVRGRALSDVTAAFCRWRRCRHSAGVGSAGSLRHDFAMVDSIQVGSRARPTADVEPYAVAGCWLHAAPRPRRMPVRTPGLWRCSVSTMHTAIYTTYGQGQNRRVPTTESPKKQ